MFYRALVLLSAVLAVVGTATAAARQPTAGSLVPAPAALGPEWSLLGASQTESAYPPFSSTASAMYGGPAGSRVFVRVFVMDPGETATHADATDQAFAGIRSLVREDADATDAAGATDQSTPIGCVEVRRTEGKDAAFPDFPAGVTACTADSDIVVLVGVFGTINGRGGSRASDAVVELILRHQAVATPTSLTDHAVDAAGAVSD